MPDNEVESRFEHANYASTIGQFDVAFRIYSDLARSGHIGAMMGLAHMYLRGEGTAHDVEKGARIYGSGSFSGK